MGASRLTPGDTTIEMRLLGRFGISVGAEPVDVAPIGQRVLALLGVLGGVADRNRVAGTVWPDRAEDRALANLRSALWRLPDQVRHGVAKQGDVVSLDSRWTVDLDDTVRRARELKLAPAPDMSVVPFTEDLLPDWDIEWLALPRERHRQLRLHALEDLAAAQIHFGRPLDAVDTVMAAVDAEPLRETAQCLLLQAHLAAGNRAAVLRQYEAFRLLLAEELSLQPGPSMREIIELATRGR